MMRCTGSASGGGGGHAVLQKRPVTSNAHTSAFKLIHPRMQRVRVHVAWHAWTVEGVLFVHGRRKSRCKECGGDESAKAKILTRREQAKISAITSYLVIVVDL